MPGQLLDARRQQIRNPEGCVSWKFALDSVPSYDEATPINFDLELDRNALDSLSVFALPNRNNRHCIAVGCGLALGGRSKAAT
jgi:hypothetical protein